VYLHSFCICIINLLFNIFSFWQVICSSFLVTCFFILKVQPTSCSPTQFDFTMMVFSSFLLQSYTKYRVLWPWKINGTTVTTTKTGYWEYNYLHTDKLSTNFSRNIYFLFERVIVAERQVSNFSAISWRDNMLWWDDVYFVLELHA